MTEEQEPVDLVADVIREAVACDRPQCLPEDHTRFVQENMAIATQQINDQSRNAR